MMSLSRCTPIVNREDLQILSYFLFTLWHFGFRPCNYSENKVVGIKGILMKYRPTRPFKANTPKRCPFHYRRQEHKIGSQETPGITGKFGLGIQNEAGKRLIEFCQENALVIANTLFQQYKRRLSHGHHQMVNTKIRLIIFFAAKDGEALYNQKKNNTRS